MLPHTVARTRPITFSCFAGAAGVGAGDGRGASAVGATARSETARMLVGVIGATPLATGRRFRHLAATLKVRENRRGAPRRERLGMPLIRCPAAGSRVPRAKRRRDEEVGCSSSAGPAAWGLPRSARQ